MYTYKLLFSVTLSFILYHNLIKTIAKWQKKRLNDFSSVHSHLYTVNKSLVNWMSELWCLPGAHAVPFTALEGCKTAAAVTAALLLSETGQWRALRLEKARRGPWCSTGTWTGDRLSRHFVTKMHWCQRQHSPKDHKNSLNLSLFSPQRGSGKLPDLTTKLTK